MVFRVWALRVEKARPEGHERRQVSLRRALLLYRFERPAAKIVRAIFYFWTLFVIVDAVGRIIGDLMEPSYLASDAFFIIAFAWDMRWPSNIGQRGLKHDTT
jgi:hypothetical protein